MTKRLIVFGNGLGRAIDNTFFSLETALGKAWESDVIDADKKAELYSWAVLEKDTAPKTEEQFGRIFVAIREAKTLHDKLLIEKPKLSEEDILSLCHEVACHFHKFSANPFDTRLDDFIEALRNHSLIKQSSIATLNYDSLLYPMIVDAKFDDGFRRLESLVFREHVLCDALQKEKPLYLHLHGSPYFFTEQTNGDAGKIIKGRKGNSPKISGPSQHHIILNNSYFKQADIEDDDLLAKYWNAYRTLVAKAERIFLFGYSGCDDHLNATINLLGKGQVTRVVEYESTKYHPADPKTEISQSAYWDLIIPSSKVIPMPNILDFRDWEQ